MINDQPLGIKDLIFNFFRIFKEDFNVFTVVNYRKEKSYSKTISSKGETL
jgi:hypothetical protein